MEDGVNLGEEGGDMLSTRSCYQGATEEYFGGERPITECMQLAGDGPLLKASQAIQFKRVLD